MLLDLYLSPYPSFREKPHCKSVKSIDLTNVTKNCKQLLTSVSVLVGQLPPLFFICFIILFLFLLNFLHLNIRWSTVSSSSSSHGHIGLHVLPAAWNYLGPTERIFIKFDI